MMKMYSKQKQSLFLILCCSCLFGCVDFAQDVQPPADNEPRDTRYSDTAGTDDTDKDTSTGSETDPSADAGADSETGPDADTETDTEIDSGDDTETSTTIDSGVNTGDTEDGGVEKGTDTYSDTDTDTDTTEPLKCSKPAGPENGSVEVSSDADGGIVATYTCDKGFHLKGSGVEETVAYRSCESNGAWSGDAPVCIRVQCPKLDPPEHGSIINYLDEQYYESEVFFSCEEGKYVDGDATRICQLDGTWSNETPVCSDVHCSELDAPDKGFIDETVHDYSTIAGSIVEFGCNDSYAMNGPQYLTCNNDGTWDPENPPSCVFITCADPGALTNGIVEFSNPPKGYGSKVEYTCSTGFHIEGSAATAKYVEYECEDTGAWSGTKPTCVAVNCGTPPTYSNTSRTVTSTTYGGKATYSCLPGSAGLPGALTCTDSGEWQGTEPTCATVCPDLNNPMNGTVEYQNRNVGSYSTYTCNTGHRISGYDNNEITTDTRECLDTGQWSGTAPRCEKKDCGTPTEYAYAAASYTSTTFEATAVYACKTGYTGPGSTIECNSNGEWSGSSPKCTGVNCGSEPDAPTDGRVETCTNGVNYDSVCSFSCNDGYELSHTATRICRNDGSWSGTTPTCTGIRCGELPTVSNASPDQTGILRYPASVVYSCNEGFEGTPETYQCSTDGNWSGSGPTCTSVTCDELSAPENGNLDLEGTNPNDKATFRCNDDYTLVGSTNYTCGSDGQWYPEITVMPYCKFNWSYRRTIVISGGTFDLPMLVMLPSTIKNHSQADGSDLRFTTNASGEPFNIPYHIENWDEGKIWIKLINSASTVYMFYGNPDAPGAQVSHSTMFPNATTLSGIPTLRGDETYDHLTIPSNVTALVHFEEILHITAAKIVIEGTIDGLGRGYTYGNVNDEGQGGSSPDGAGGGGGGYGNVGGDGGETDPSYVAGIGGSIHGDTWLSDPPIQMGSSGGNGYMTTDSGAPGGGAVWLDAQEIVFNGTINVNGENGKKGSYGAGGGGSGGGILLTGNHVTVGDSAKFSAIGGLGGSPDTNHAGGGGGAGGRVKVYHDSSLSFSPDASVNLSGGDGGVGTVASGKGHPGKGGTSVTDEISEYPRKVIVGSETAL